MNGRTIVVVEDEPEVLLMVQSILEDEGYDVVGVNHPRVIDGAIAGHAPSLFLIDIMLPGTSGIAVAEQLRTGKHGIIPRVAMSASDGLIRHATASGWFAATLGKPFDIDELLDCVAQHLAA